MTVAVRIFFRRIALAVALCLMAGTAFDQRGTFGSAVASDAPAERIVLLIADDASPPGTCRLDDMLRTFHAVRFEGQVARGAQTERAIATFAARSENADAAIIYACNAHDPTKLVTALRARQLNFLFLLDTVPGRRTSSDTPALNAGRDDLIVIRARIATPENDEIFARTLSHKIKRPYSPPQDILSRTVVSSYYESRGSMLIALQGKIASNYIIAKPPTEQILDAWSRVQHSKDRAKLEAFVAAYPKTLFADIAQEKLKALP